MARSPLTASETAHLQKHDAGRWILFGRGHRPPDARVQEAKTNIQIVLGDLRRGQLISARDLYKQLKEDYRQGRATVQWALYDLAMAELVMVKPPPGAKLEGQCQPDFSVRAVDDAGKWTPDQLNMKFHPDSELETTHRHRHLSTNNLLANATPTNDEEENPVADETGSGAAVKGKKRGRKVKDDTIRRADFVKPLREKNMSYPAIYDRYKRKYFRDVDASPDVLRHAFERQYPEVAAKLKNKDAT